MSEPICECGHGMPRHDNFADNSGCRVLVASSLPTKGVVCCPCQCFTDTRIAALEAQLAEARKAIVSAINILECEYGYSMAKGNFPMLYTAIEAVGKEGE